MVSQKVTITNPEGLHLRPAGLLNNLAVQYKSKIEFDTGKGIYNAKSVLSLLGACVRNGDTITLMCEGPDEEEALAALVSKIESGLEA